MKTQYKFSFSAIFLSAVLLTSCNSNDAVKHADAANKQSPETVTVEKINTDDAQFATSAADGGMMEVEMGKLCAQQTKNSEVKKLGAMMVADHTNFNNELKVTAGNKNLILPVMMSDKNQKMVDNMRNKSGSDFDRSYVNMMVNDHTDDITDFKKESATGKDADISSFATRALPTLQKHLDAAKATLKVI